MCCWVMSTTKTNNMYKIYGFKSRSIDAALLGVQELKRNVKAQYFLSSSSIAEATRTEFTVDLLLTLKMEKYCNVIQNNNPI